MPTNYPTSIDALTNPTSGNALTSPSHASQHANANDAIEAIEGSVGFTGSSFPGAPAAGDRFWRTDRLLHYVDVAGVGWVTTQLFSEPIGYADNISASADLTADRLPGDSAFPLGLYMVDFSYAFNIATGGTALGASHKWDIFLKSFVGNTGTARAQLTINSGASVVWRNIAGVAINTTLTGIDMFQVNVTKTGTPGNLSGIGRFTYHRLG